MRFPWLIGGLLVPGAKGGVACHPLVDAKGRPPLSIPFPKRDLRLFQCYSGLTLLLQQQLFSRSPSCSSTRNCVGSSSAGLGWAAAVPSPGSLFSRRKRCVPANNCCCRTTYGTDSKI